MRKFCGALAVLCVAGATLYAQATLSNSDVIKMANAGLSDEFITNLVDQQGSHLSTDVASLIEMRQGGVNERILSAVVKKAPSQEPFNSDSVLRLVQAGFTDDFVANLIMSHPGEFSTSGARIVELKQAGVSERLLSLMVGGSRTRTLPSGTQISVRLIDGIDSERDRVGDEFRASLEEPLKIGDEVVAPKGADARIRLAEDRQSGKLTGKAELAVQLLSVVVNGNSVPVETTSVSKYSKSQGVNTAEKAVGVGALGAIIGALAGGGKGAAIGAGAGAAAGAGSGVFMHGQRVKLPSETKLTFTTQMDVSLP